MQDENQTQRKRCQARERKQAQRDRERKHRNLVGVSEFRMELYQGTREALARICQAGQFSEPAEAITLLVHNVADLAERDPSRFAEFIKTRCHA